MVRDTTNSVTLRSGVSHHGRKVSMKSLANVLIKNRQPVFRTEDHMDKNKRKRTWHSAQYRSGFQPSVTRGIGSWGFAPRWYGTAPLALFAAIIWLASLVTGCKSAPTQPTLSTLPNYAKVSNVVIRPTVPPPPFKLFHQTPGFLTLVTADNATDDQIEAILWQLRDAAKAHTFDALHIPQKLIDARDPVVAIHIYRGTKCAAEGYANGAPPCGPSYHAAGDFTFGGFTNPNRTDGVLHQDPTHDITLWNPDTP